MFRSHKWTALLAIFALAVLAPPAPAHQQPSPEMQKVIEAEQLVNQGNPDGALAIVQALIAENAEFAPAHFIAGLAYVAKEKTTSGDEKTEYCRSAYDSFLKAAEYQPGWGIAHRMASMHAADRGDIDASWQQAIKAHQSGTDMNDAFAGLGSMSEKPADLEQQLAVKRVFVAPMDTEAFQSQGDTTLGGSSSAGSSRTDVGRRVVNEAAADIAQFQREANRQFANSRAFGLVQRPEMADLIMVFEVDSIADSTRRRTRGFMKLLDAKSGEEAYRRRVELADIATRAELNRDFSQIMRIMEEWAAENLR
jgi:hypothetical protein